MCGTEYGTDRAHSPTLPGHHAGHGEDQEHRPRRDGPDLQPVQDAPDHLRQGQLHPERAGQGAADRHELGQRDGGPAGQPGIRVPDRGRGQSPPGDDLHHGKRRGADPGVAPGDRGELPHLAGAAAAEGPGTAGGRLRKPGGDSRQAGIA